MENASKALIIAGAILISILLISVGIIVMNAINKPIEEAGGTSESYAIQMFNDKFSSYMGANLDYNTVKDIFNIVTSANGSAEVKADIANRKVVFEGDIDSITDLERTKKYDVEITDSKGDDGFYDKVKITVHTGT